MLSEFKNSKGLTYYFHRKGHLMYFSKNAEGAVELPEGFEVIENSRTGLPLAKKKKG